jgi:hypothetical protein
VAEARICPTHTRSKEEVPRTACSTWEKAKKDIAGTSRSDTTIGSVCARHWEARVARPRTAAAQIS